MSSVRLLVIDDSATVRAIVEQIIEADCECRVVGLAGSVEAARKLLLEVRPNIISLDLNLPGMSGMDFLDELSEQEHVPIVVLSSASQAGSETAQQAIARGAYACFDKNKVMAESERFRGLLKKAVHRYERDRINVAKRSVRAVR